MKGATAPRSSSMVSVRICRSERSFSFRYSFSIWGNSLWQGPHQVAQTLIRTARPSRFFRRQVLQERSASSNAGMSFPVSFIKREHSCPARSASERSEEHTSELQSLRHLVCRLLLEKK